MNMETCFAVIADCNVPDRAQHLALLADLDLPVAPGHEVEPADGCALEGADRGQRCGGDPGLIGECCQPCKRLFAGIEDNDVNPGSRFVSYKLALHGPMFPIS